MYSLSIAWLACTAGFPLGPPADRFGDPLPAGAVARLGFVRTSTSSPPNIGDGPLAAFAPDGRLFATACYNRVYVWDVTTGRVRRRLEVGDDRVGRLVFTADGRDLVARTHGGRFRRWRLETGREVLGEVEGAAQWGDAHVSPGGRWLLSPQGDVWDLPRGERAWPGRLPINKGHASVAFSADERWLFVAGRDDDGKYALEQWDVAAGKRARVFDNVPGGPIALSPDGRLVAVTLTIPAPGAVNKWTHTVALYDTAAGRERLRLPAGPGQFDRPVFSADGKRFAAVVGLDTLNVWDAVAGKVLATWKYNREHLGWLAFSPDGRWVGACGAEGTAVLWEVATGKPRFLTTEVPQRVSDLSFSPDGRRLAAGHSDGTLRLWDLATQEVRHEVRHGESPAYSGLTRLGWLGPDGPLVFRTQAPADGFRLFDPTTGRDTPLSLGDGIEIQSVSPAGRTMIVGRGTPAPHDFTWRPLAPEKLEAARKRVKDRPELRDFRVLAPVAVPEPAPLAPVGPFSKLQGLAAAQAVTVSADGSYRVELVLTMSDAFGMTNAGPHWGPRGLRVVDVETGRVVREVGRTQQHAVAFTPDGRGLVFWRGPFTDYELELLEARTGRARWKATLGKPVGNLAVSPDGHWLAATDREGDALHLIDATTGKTVVTHRVGRLFSGPDVLTFSPDGRWVARPAEDGTVLIWQVPASRPRNETEFTADDLAAAWRDLASADAAAAFRAVVRLADARAVPFLRRELLREDERERIERLVAGLDAAAFADRERATRELAALGELARPFLARASRAGPSLEAETRLEKLLAAIADPFATPAGLRQLRAVEALERIGSADARRVLDRLAATDPDDPLAREARRAVDRLGR